ncbi:MAG: hypothetical protein ABI172_10545 [Ginsengibacter sp.]
MKKIYFHYILPFFRKDCFIIKKPSESINIVLAIVMVIILQSLPKHIVAQNTYSYSYQNVTRNVGGGTLEKGDIIEVRALVLVNVTTNNFYYIDTIRTGTQFVSGSLKIVTNEGLVFRGPYSDAADSDLGVYDVSGGVPRVRVNLGAGAASPTAGTGPAQFGSTSGGGKVIPNDKPKYYGKTLFIVAYRLLITANFDDIINLTGNYYYDNKNFRFNYAGIKVIQNQGLCANFSSATFSAESDFGSGNIQNRVLGANVPGYSQVNLGPNAPGDGYYSIANNTSANGTTNDAGPYKPNPARVFDVWDIIGDHTGAADPLLGNPPTPASPKTNGGYMLVVNAAYATGEVYRDQIKDVCPNTYYEFSAWIRNICGKCSLDSNGLSPMTPGALPNLAFTINDIDYFTTGNIPYNKKWEKRGFIYKTGPTETQFNITIKNNAPGGGGNDWVLDDIKLATCYPNLIMNPGDTAKSCSGLMIHLSDTVKSYFNNYNNFCWEKSTDGTVWTSTGVCGTKVPVLKDGLWVYVVDTVFTPVAADSGTFYRLKVATTFSNLSDAKCVVNNSQKVFLKVYNMDCSALEAQFLSFIGKITNDKSTLKWVSKNEEDLKEYEVEKSTDGINFYKSGSVTAVNDFNGANYIYNDPELISSAVYYRLKLISKNVESQKYSKAIVLYNRNTSFKITTANPFRSNLKVDIFVPADGNVELNLCDMYGKIVSKKSVQLSKGNSQVTMDEVNRLPVGLYILRAMSNGIVVQNKLYKSN